MDEAEMIWAATVAIGKNMDFETLKYSDYMHGKEDLTDDVWEYVIEHGHFGSDAFNEKYSKYKRY
ncbi:MAG: hypothetical protein V3V84_07775 [Candidatus Bathyarchaeia archaeon]